jgi:streptogramin lyase
MKTWWKSRQRKHSRDDRRSGRLKPRFRPWLEPLEERIEPAPVWNSFPVPIPAYGTGGSASGGVNDITAGPDGAVWYTANWTVTPSAGASWVMENFIGRVAPDGSITQFTVPAPAPQTPQYLGSIITGPDGNLWFMNSGLGIPSSHWIGTILTLYRMTPQGQLTAFQVPVIAPVNPESGHNELVDGPDGNMWFVTRGGIGRVTTSGQFTVFYLPPDITADSIIAGSDGNLWFTYDQGSVPNAAPPLPYPFVPTVGVGSITVDGTIRFTDTFPAGTVFPANVGDVSSGSCLGPDGNVWVVTENNSSGPWLLNRITPAGVVTTFNLPLEAADPASGGAYQDVMVGPDGNLWLDSHLRDAGNVLKFWDALTVVNTNGEVLAEYPLSLALPTRGPDGNMYGLANPTSGANLSDAPPYGSIAQLTFPIAGPVTRLEVSASVPNVTVGSPFSITVRAEDPNGVTDTAYQGTVHFLISQDSENNIPADYTFTAQDQGVHTFTGLSFRVSGQREIMVSDAATGVMGATNLITSSGPAVAIALTARADNPQNGCPQAVQVEALDAYGNAATGYTGTVHFTSSDPLAQLPADYTFTASDQGVHSFNVSFGTIGSEQLTVSDGTLSDSNTYVNGPPIFSGDFQATIDTNNVVAGTPFDLTVVAMTYDPPFAANSTTDTAYRGTIHFISDDPRTILPPDYTFTTADRGEHTFSMVVDSVGTQLWVEDLALGRQVTVINGPNQTDLSPGPIAQLQLRAPAQAIAGQPFILSVTATDAYGNIIPYYDWVNFSASETSATLPAAYQFQATDAGVHTFTGLVLNSTGPQTIQVTDPRFGISSSITLDVQAGPAPPPPPTINTFNPAGIVIANIVAGSDGALWGSGGAPALSRITVNGQISVVSIPGPSPTPFITVGPDGNLYVQDYPGVIVFNPVTQAGTYLSQSFPVKAIAGADGNFWGSGRYPSDTEVTRMTPDGTFTEFASGWFNLSFYSTSDLTQGPDGNIWFTYDASFNQSSITGIARITPQGGVTTIPTVYSPPAGGPPGVTPMDRLAVGSDGNLWFFNYDNRVEVIDRMSPDGAITEFPLPTLPPFNIGGPALVSGPDGNLWSFTEAQGSNIPGACDFVRITPSGMVTLYPEPVPEPAGFDTGTVGPDGNLWFSRVVYPSSVLEQIVLPPEGAPASFMVSTSHTTTNAGAPFSVTVRVLDANGMQVVGYRGTVHFSSSDQQAGLPADYTFTAADQGVHTFLGIQLKTAGTQTLSASDSALAINGSLSLSVEPGPASLQLQIAQAVDAYHQFQVTVTVADAFGNRITSYAGTVHFDCADISAILPPDYTFTSADQGVHTFTVVLGTPGMQFLTVSDTSGQFPGTTIPIAVNPGTASIIVTAPSTVGIDQLFTFTVKVVDGSGNVMTDYRGVMNFSSFVTANNVQWTNSPAGLVYGRFTAADAGVHTFSISLNTGNAEGGINLKAPNIDEIDVTDANNGSLKGSTLITVAPISVPSWIHNYPFGNGSVSDVVTGSDGAMWGVAPTSVNIGFSPETIYRVTPDGSSTNFLATRTNGFVPTAYAFGPDGNLWIENYDEIAPYPAYMTRVTPQGGVTNFPINGVSGSMVAGPDGDLTPKY